MADIMPQQGFMLSRPASRQDVISALLSDYGNSFGREDASPTAHSPLSSKELPPPPPPRRSDSLRNHTLLPAIQRMNRKFQLRVEEDTASSSYSQRTASPLPKPRKRIVSRSLSREYKPPSLKLVISNGTTATIPPTPVSPVPELHSAKSCQSKDLPPPPPAKSERRSTRQDPMGNELSKNAKDRDLARNDSLLSQGQQTQTRTSSEKTSQPLEVSQPMKRKALPETAVRKLKSLAELGHGSRGGKGKPLPPTFERKEDGDRVGRQAQEADAGNVTNAEEASEDSNSDASDLTVTLENSQQQEQKAPANHQLPPTPDDVQNISAPAPPQKAYAALGLPSNPSANGPASPIHLRKDNLNSHTLQPHRAAPKIPTATLTPEMTPSPRLKPVQPKNRGPISPLSPLPPPKDQIRPFSCDTPATTQEAQATATTAPLTTTTTTTNLSSASFDPASPAYQTLLHTLFQPQGHNSPGLFTPLTRQPRPVPSSLIPTITANHLSCYTAHATHTFSNNAYQPLGCMVCRTNSPDRKWCCAWCRLRICLTCSTALARIPSRDLRVLLQQRAPREATADANTTVLSGAAALSEEEKGEVGDVLGVGFNGRMAG